MPEHDTVETPLPPGTIPDQENVITQEIPTAKEPFPEIQLVSPVRVELPPLHLINDPIMTMGAPVADDTALYDQLNPPAPTPPPRRERRRMKTGDRFLLCMGVAVIGMGTVAYGMVVYGWGAGPGPADEAVAPAHTASTSPTTLPTTGPVELYKAPAKAPVHVVADPTHYSPTPTRSITVVSPAPQASTSAPQAPVETSRAPEPPPVHTTPSTPPPSTASSPPAPTGSASPSQSGLLPSLLTSPPASTPEETADAHQ